MPLLQPLDGRAVFTRHGMAVGPSGSGWISEKAWIGCIVKRGTTYYLFMNGTGPAGEKIGVGTSSSIDGPWAMDDVMPVARHRQSGEWDDTFVGQPWVFPIGNLWVMEYYGFDLSGAADGIAWTTDEAFPRGWTKHAANPLLNPGPETYDSFAAHKSFSLVTPTTIYHFYTANGNGVRSVALAVAPLPQLPDLAAQPQVRGTNALTLLASLLTSLRTLGLSIDASLTLIHDTFTRADGALSGSTTSDGGGVWEVEGAGFAVACNQLAWTGTGDYAAAIDTGLRDNYAIQSPQPRSPAPTR